MATQKKPLNSVALGVGVLCVILLIATIATYFDYSTMVTNRDSQITDQSNQIDSLNTQINDMQTSLDGNVSEINSLNAQIITLQSELSSANAQVTTLTSQLSTANSQATSLQNQVNTLNAQITSLNAQISTLNNWLNGNVTALANANTQISNLNASLNGNVTALATANIQIASLNSQLTSLNAPNLVQINLVGSDNRPLLQNAYLLVTGYECNVGTNPAYNSQIHVVAYQGSVVAIDTYINLGTILGHGWHISNQNVYYTGSALTNYTLTLVWTSS